MTHRHMRFAGPIVYLPLLLSMGIGFAVSTQAAAAPPLEFCPQRAPDQQVGSARTREQHESGSRTDCTPLAERTTSRASDKSDGPGPHRPARQLTLDNLQQEVSTFLNEYRRFLDCCKNDPAELASIEALGDYVDDLLRAAQRELFSEHLKLRGMTVREMLAPVGAARQELRVLHTHLRELGMLLEQREAVGAGEAADAPTMDGMDAVPQPQPPPPSSLSTGPKTGVGIGVTPSTGRNIGKTPRSGTAIGAEGRTGLEIGATPKTGREIGTTGPTGFEVGATGRAGPGIGESTFNSDASSAVGSSLQPSSIESTLDDSTVGSTIGGSTIGSSLADSTIGSSLGGSSVGSSLQNRSTRP